MRWIAAALALASIAQPAIAQKQVVERGSDFFLSAPIKVQLDGIPTGTLVVMLLRDVMRVPYVIAPDVLSDRRATSVNLLIPRNEIPVRVVSYLRRTGFTVELVGGTVYVGRKGSRFGSAGQNQDLGFPDPETRGSAFVPSGSPVALGRADMPVASQIEVQGSSPGPIADVPSPVAHSILAYIPAHRDPAYLSSVLAPLLPGLTFGGRDQARVSGGDQVANTDQLDTLVMTGPDDDLARARRLIVQLDRARPMVAVKAVVMQVSDIRNRGSALSLLVKVAGGKLSVGSFPTEAPASQFIRVSTAAVQALLSAVREDSRFRVVATPNLAALSGASASMNSGSQVPTIGSVAVNDGGAVQSVVYRDSGISLIVRPVVRGDLIELDVQQERSTFTRTTTGVEDSPTLNKASASALVTLKSGESVVLAGLTETSDGNTREGLLGGLLGVRSREHSNSELLVVLQAELVPLPDARPGEFIDISSDEEERDDCTDDPLAADPCRATAPVPGAERA